MGGPFSLICMQAVTQVASSLINDDLEKLLK